MTKNRSPWLDLIAFMLLTGMFCGLAGGFRDVVAHDHLSHGMVRLALLAVRDAVNLWLLVAALGAMLVLAARVAVPLAWNTVVSSSIEIRFSNPRRVVSCLAAALTGAVMWVGDAWLVNHFVLPVRFTRLHPVALAVDLGLLVVTAVVFWMLSRMDWTPGLLVMRRMLLPGTVVLLVGVVALNGLVLAIEQVRRPARPNVVLIVVDTLRADHMSRIGPPESMTPNLDALASHGWLFRRAISPAPWTMPAVASIMTSQYPRVLGITTTATVVGKRFVTLAEAFREAGYDTAGIVSHTFVSGKLGLGQGFDLYDEECAGGHGHISSPAMTDKALAFVADHKDRAFFLFLHYFDPHYDFIQHDGHGSVPSYEGNVSSGEAIQSLRLKAGYLSMEDVAYIRALYGSEVGFTDHHLGRLLNGLKQAGLYDDTIIVFAADHGEEFCERGDDWIGHTRTLYQEVIHVPLIIKPTGTSRGRTSDQFVGLIDVAPTILDLAEVTNPRASRTEGASLRDSVDPDTEARPIFSETRRDDYLQSVILSGKKLIHRPVPDVYELYDLVADPSESRNLVEDDPETLELLGKILDDWDDYIEKRRSGAVVERPELTNEQERMLQSLGYL